ncbi:MAG: sugar ABC transporter permease [Arachnia sp.]
MNTTTTVRRRDRREQQRIDSGFGRGHLSLALLLMTPAFVIIGIVIAYPLFKAVSLSFTKTTLLRPERSSFVGLDNYAKLVSDGSFWSALGNTVVWTSCSVVLAYIIGLCLALALNERFLGRGVIRGLMLVPWVTPGVVVGLLFLFIYNGESGLLNYVLKSVGILDSFQAWLGQPSTALTFLILACVWNQVPFYMLNILAGLSSMPTDIIEAGRVDGASKWQRFWHITFPQLRGVTVISTALMTIWNFNNFDLIWSTTQGGPITATTTLVVYVYRTAFEAQNLGYAGALGVAWLLILFVFAFFYIRVMAKGALK